MGDRPGRELPKKYREIARELVDNQGWRYEAGGKRGGHPMLYPGHRSQPPLPVPTSPKRAGRAFANWVADARRRGGQWPKRGK